MLLDDLAPRRFLRHEQRADRVLAGLRQLEADLGGLAREEGVRDLHEDAGAVAGARIGADRAAMLEIAEDGERVGRRSGATCLPLMLAMKPTPQESFSRERIVEAFGRRTPGVFARNLDRFRIRGRRQRICDDAFALEFRPAHFPQSSRPASENPIVVHRRTLGVAAPTGPPLVRSEPQCSEFRLGRSSSPENVLPGTLAALKAPIFRCNPYAGIATKLRQ